MPGKIITGLFAKDGKLYVSNLSDGKIHVYDIATMTEDRNWSCPDPTRLTLDQAGNVWVIHYKYGGLDQSSNPLWDATNATSEVVSAFKPVRRVIYDSDSDTMYLAGDVKEQNWGSFLRVKKFTDWSKGNRNAAFTAEYVVVFENAAWANIQMYRWCPSGACMSTATTPSSKTNDK